MMEAEKYLQICDRTKLTAKRSLKKKEGRSNLLKWAVCHILGKEQTVKVEEEEEEEEAAFLCLQTF